MTLTAASTVVFVEFTWTPSLLNQAEDRVHRLTQKNSVNIYYLYGPNTLDDWIFNMLGHKSRVIKDTMDGWDPSIRKQKQICEPADVPTPTRDQIETHIAESHGLKINNIEGYQTKY